MKGFITLTSVTATGDSEPITMPVSGIVFRGSDKPGIRAAIWFEPQPDDAAIYHVRESPAQIAQLIQECQAPTADEIAAQVLFSASEGVTSSYDDDDNDEPTEFHIFAAKQAYQYADALVEERKRRNAIAGSEAGE